MSLFHFRATLDLNLRHINLEKKNTHDQHSRKAREKDRDLRNLKKAELQLRVAEDSLAHTQQVHEKVKSSVSNNDIRVHAISNTNWSHSSTRPFFSSKFESHFSSLLTVTSLAWHPKNVCTGEWIICQYLNSSCMINVCASVTRLMLNQKMMEQ